MIKHTLVQGDTFVTSDPNVEVNTILGSCVSICLHDTVTRVGGINHFLLPGENHADNRQLRYGLHAFEVLLNELLKRGASRNTLEAKLFGGAASEGVASTVGEQNASFAINLLSEEDITVKAHSLGGCLARKLLYIPATGDAFVREVPRSTAA